MANASSSYSNFTVLLGLHDQNNMKGNPAVQVRKARRVISHPDFDETTYENDLGLVELDDAVDFDGAVFPICLPIDGVVDQSEVCFTKQMEVLYVRYVSTTCTLATYCEQLLSKSGPFAKVKVAPDISCQY